MTNYNRVKVAVSNALLARLGINNDGIVIGKGNTK